MQLTGRAGRRGVDEIGQSYIFFDESVNSNWYFELFNTKSNRLESQYSLSYTSITGLLKLYKKKAAMETLSRSFWVFQNQYNIDLLNKDFIEKYDFLQNFSFILFQSALSAGQPFFATGLQFCPFRPSSGLLGSTILYILLLLSPILPLRASWGMVASCKGTFLFIPIDYQLPSSQIPRQGKSICPKNTFLFQSSTMAWNPRK